MSEILGPLNTKKKKKMCVPTLCPEKPRFVQDSIGIVLARSWLGSLLLFFILFYFFFNHGSVLYPFWIRPCFQGIFNICSKT